MKVTKYSVSVSVTHSVCAASTSVSNGAAHFVNLKTDVENAKQFWILTWQSPMK